MRDISEMMDVFTYETPHVEIIEVVVEKGFAVSDLESPERGENSGW